MSLAVSFSSMRRKSKLAAVQAPGMAQSVLKSRKKMNSVFDDHGISEDSRRHKFHQTEKTSHVDQVAAFGDHMHSRPSSLSPATH